MPGVFHGTPQQHKINLDFIFMNNVGESLRLRGASLRRCPPPPLSCPTPMPHHNPPPSHDAHRHLPFPSPPSLPLLTGPSRDRKFELTFDHFRDALAELARARYPGLPPVEAYEALVVLHVKPLYRSLFGDDDAAGAGAAYEPDAADGGASEYGSAAPYSGSHTRRQARLILTPEGTMPMAALAHFQGPALQMVVSEDHPLTDMTARYNVTLTSGAGTPVRPGSTAVSSSSSSVAAGAAGAGAGGGLDAWVGVGSGTPSSTPVALTDAGRSALSSSYPGFRRSDAEIAPARPPQQLGGGEGGGADVEALRARLASVVTALESMSVQNESLQKANAALVQQLTAQLRG
jgi:hypothetical protein